MAVKHGRSRANYSIGRNEDAEGEPAGMMDAESGEMPMRGGPMMPGRSMAPGPKPRKKMPIGRRFQRKGTRRGA